MANGGKDVRLGDDKRPVSIVPNSEVNLFNIANGEILTDEFGTPLVVEVDQFFASDVSSERSTSITFPENAEDGFVRQIFSKVGTFTTVTYGVNFDVHINTATAAQAGGGNVGFGTTVALATGGSLTGDFVDVGLGVSALSFSMAPRIDIKTLTDQGGIKNRLYFEDNVINNDKVIIKDKIDGTGIPDGTYVGKAFASYLIISNEPTVSGITTLAVDIRRGQLRKQKANNVLTIEEQFKETSEVSSSLLGIPRAETQLSLFSNVSSYGLNDDEFEFFAFNGGNSFSTWDQRANKFYGPRYNAQRSEEVQESAIKLEAFPVPYSYPFNAAFSDVGFFDETLFEFYKKFIQLGNRLYNYYNTGPGAAQGYPADWKEKFLNPSSVTVTNSNPDYIAGITASFALIDTWTDTWRDIAFGGLVDPVTLTAFDFTKVNTLSLVGGPFSSSNTRPGYGSGGQRYSYLQSRRVFRYQPGRISGFTFGLRASTEPQPGATMEWGIKNPTDQYVFRMNKGNLSIIRRSTIPLPPSALERSGLTALDQIQTQTGDPYDDRLYHTIEIPSDKFIHDQLNGNGPSGYNLGANRVTMYKIEFGWYGAIGARFYAYIPAGPGEARWVKIHTLVIENSIGQPCLEDSYFRLSYSLDVTNAEFLREPVFLYKYGASYYIDGGDEGTTRIHSVSSKAKAINSIENRTLIGITPKNFILNSIGTEIKNKKLIIPTTMNITSDSLAKVEVVRCRACPGFAHVHTPGLAAGTSGPSVDIRLADQNKISAINGTTFKTADLNAKIIAPSIWNAYITDLQDETSNGSGEFQTAIIKGFSGLDGYPALASLRYDVLVRDSVTGVVSTLQSGDSAPDYGTVRLSSQDKHYFASDFKFTGTKIEIQFLNPGNGDAFGHFADFSVGITNYEPDISGSDLLGFKKPSGGTFTTVTSLKTRGLTPEVLYAEHTHSRVSQNEIGVRTSEAFTAGTFPVRMGIDSRISNPPGVATGACSRVTVEVLDSVPIAGLEEFLGSALPAEAGITGADLTARFIKKPGLFPAGIDFDGGQIKVTSEEEASNTSKYVGEPRQFTETATQTLFSFIKISATLNQTGEFSIDIRPVKMTANGNPVRQKLFNFNPFPLYFFAKLSDGAAINNISIKETTSGFQRTISPRFFPLGTNASITNAGGKADVSGAPPTNFEEVTRLSSALTDIQNRQNLRPTTAVDTVYIGEDQTLEVDMSKIFGQDRNVITPDNLNVEATFLVAQKIKSGNGEIEATLNYKEQ